MKLILASDVHSNLVALEAFFSYLQKNGLENEGIYFLGDYVNLGPCPDETINLIRNSGAKICLAGNHDRYIVNPQSLDHNPYFGSKDGIVHTRWTRSQISKDNLEWLKNLPTRHTFEVGELTIDMVHGRHNSDEETIDASKLKTDRPTLYICGHTHVPRHQKIGLAHIINPGSLGKPLDKDNRGAFGIVSFEKENPLQKELFNFEVVRFTYDIDKTISSLEKKDVPWRKGIIESLKTAVYTDED